VAGMGSGRREGCGAAEDVFRGGLCSLRVRRINENGPRKVGRFVVNTAKRVDRVK